MRFQFKPSSYGARILRLRELAVSLEKPKPNHLHEVAKILHSFLGEIADRLLRYHFRDTEASVDLQTYEGLLDVFRDGTAIVVMLEDPRATNLGKEIDEFVELLEWCLIYLD